MKQWFTPQQVSQADQYTASAEASYDELVERAKAGFDDQAAAGKELRGSLAVASLGAILAEQFEQDENAIAALSLMLAVAAVRTIQAQVVPK